MDKKSNKKTEYFFNLMFVSSGLIGCITVLLGSIILFASLSGQEITILDDLSRSFITDSPQGRGLIAIAFGLLLIVVGLVYRMMTEVSELQKQVKLLSGKSSSDESVGGASLFIETKNNK